MAKKNPEPGSTSVNIKADKLDLSTGAVAGIDQSEGKKIHVTQAPSHPTRRRPALKTIAREWVPLMALAVVVVLMFSFMPQRANQRAAKVVFSAGFALLVAHSVFQLGGGIRLKGTLLGMSVRATGALAVFVLVLVLAYKNL